MGLLWTLVMPRMSSGNECDPSCESECQSFQALLIHTVIASNLPASSGRQLITWASRSRRSTLKIYAVAQHVELLITAAYM